MDEACQSEPPSRGSTTVPKLVDLIAGPAVAVEEHEPLARAAERMFGERVGSVCILQPDGALEGILTERDVLRACAAGVDTYSATVGKWMTPDPVTANATDEAAAALQVMIDRGFRHLPVLGDGGLVGVVSMRDLSIALQRTRMG